MIKAEHPMVENKQYRISCAPGDLHRYVLMPGDPDRVLKITSQWDSYEEVAHHREYRSVNGKYKGVGISACSTGIGSPSTAIAVEELLEIGCDTFIRVGSTGALGGDIDCGDMVINIGSLRMEGTSSQYVRKEYPAIANYEVLLALIQACEDLNVKYHLGIGASTDSFYLGQARPGYKGYWSSMADSLVSDLKRAKVLNFEMECSCLFTLSQIYGARAGSICAVFANREKDEFEIVGEEDCARCASEAVKILNEWDDAKRRGGKQFLTPSLIRSL